MEKIAALISSIFLFLFGNQNEAVQNQQVISNTAPTQKIEQQIEQKTKEPAFYSPIDINFLRTKTYESTQPVIEQELADGSNYKQYIASYYSSGLKIYGLLTVPKTPMPKNGYPAIVFNHGYIPPTLYRTTERYVAYVDNLARNGYVVFKIDMRGHGNSQGNPTGSYFSSAYMTDALNALSSLQKLEYVNPDKIGMWGHSMAGNLVLRAMLVSEQVKAGVIWAGAVFSYQDFAKYRISDGSYRPPNTSNQQNNIQNDPTRERSEKITQLREKPEEIDFENDPFWNAISLTKNLKYLNSPLQLHHAKNDTTTNVGYSQDLAEALKNEGKNYEYHEYEYGGHDIEGASFNIAMQKTIDFFDKHLKEPINK